MLLQKWGERGKLGFKQKSKKSEELRSLWEVKQTDEPYNKPEVLYRSNLGILIRRSKSSNKPWNLSDFSDCGGWGP